MVIYNVNIRKIRVRNIEKFGGFVLNFSIGVILAQNKKFKKLNYHVIHIK